MSDNHEDPIKMIHAMHALTYVRICGKVHGYVCGLLYNYMYINITMIMTCDMHACNIIHNAF